ncbi:unnamed protein product [Cochlearia groenlandica]
MVLYSFPLGEFYPKWFSHQGKAEVKTQVRLRQNQSRVRLRQNRSHKCKRDQGIVRTSLVHQDDDLSCDEGRRQAAEVTSSLSYRCKGKRKKTVAKRAVGQSHMFALRARVSNLSSLVTGCLKEGAATQGIATCGAANRARLGRF